MRRSETLAELRRNAIAALFVLGVVGFGTMAIMYWIK
jgi:hypothetical protein